MSGTSARSPPALSFKVLSAQSTIFTPRLGLLQLNRSSTETIQLQTPGLFLHTSRGHVPHLSGDHVAKIAPQMPWLHASLESFLETVPPTPVLQPGPSPAHKFFGVPPQRHILSLSFRDPADNRPRPANGENYATGLTVRGVRKIDPASFRNYIVAMQPDVVVALSDPTSTSSQKRTTKSIERSIRWLRDLLKPDCASDGTLSFPRNVLVNLVGGTSAIARRFFAESLLSPLEEDSALTSLPRSRKADSLLDQVAGYVVEMASLRREHDLPSSSPQAQIQAHSLKDQIAPLLQASLEPLPANKPRLVHSTRSPHEVLQLVHLCGMDLFDSHWAQKAADWGVALDFTFPAVEGPNESPNESVGLRKEEKVDVGHNLYNTRYAYDFRTLLGGEVDGPTNSGCSCLACSPSFTMPILHGSLEKAEAVQLSSRADPFTRAYIHHLLHTHEMSAHALLTTHNIAVLQKFFAGIRAVLQDHPDSFATEVARFEAVYDDTMQSMEEASRNWEEVELARGKGRLAREKKLKPGAVNAVDVVADPVPGG